MKIFTDIYNPLDYSDWSRVSMFSWQIPMTWTLSTVSVDVTVITEPYKFNADLQWHDNATIVNSCMDERF